MMWLSLFKLWSCMVNTLKSMEAYTKSSNTTFWVKTWSYHFIPRNSSLLWSYVFLSKLLFYLVKKYNYLVFYYILFKFRIQYIGSSKYLRKFPIAVESRFLWKFIFCNYIFSVRQNTYISLCIVIYTMFY